NHNLINLKKIMPQDARSLVTLFDDTEVADPYYGDIEDFERMYAHIIKASTHWLNTWQRYHE
ncbi:MAG: hypothetical protein Q4C68_07890, partial [Moraxella sp.]|nr:hypothetical protein [Moraxella sp.]